MAKTDQNAADDEAQDERAAEAAAVEEQDAAVASAETRRETQRERAAAKKSYPEDADPPTQITKSGEKAYSLARLQAQGPEFLGFESWEVAGGLHGCDQEYLTLDDARKRIEDWLNRPVGVEE